MKLKFIIALLLLGLVVEAQIVSIPNSNFKAKLLAANPSNYIAKNLSDVYFKIDANDDGEIQTTEAQQVSALDVSYANISSIEGIQSFTNIAQLNCGLNTMNAITLSGLSHLTELRCPSNTFTALNLNGLTALTTLICSGNNIATLNLSGLPNLETVDCSKNQLTWLNVSGLDDMVFLRCNDNLLTDLNVAYMPNLTTLHCYRNRISYIYLSGNTALQDFRTADNEQTHINLSNLPNLTYLDCEKNQLSSLDISDSPALQNLQCAHNQLQTLDVGSCNALGTLDCSFNPTMTSLYLKNQSNELIDIAGNTGLGFICCDASQVGSIQTSLNSSGISSVVSTDCSLGIDEMTDTHFAVWPNPVKEKLHFNSNTEIDSIEIYDINGRMVNTMNVDDNTADVTALPSGSYLIKGSNGTKLMNTKIVKE